MQIGSQALMLDCYICTLMRHFIVDMFLVIFSSYFWSTSFTYFELSAKISVRFLFTVDSTDGVSASFSSIYGSLDFFLFGNLLDFLDSHEDLSVWVARAFVAVLYDGDGGVGIFRFPSPSMLQCTQSHYV